MNQTTSEIKIRQLLYNKAPPLTSMESYRSQAKLQTMEHKLGRTKRSTQYTTESRPFFENFMTKTQDINQMGFRLPFLVNDHENPTTQIHFLEVFTHSQSLIESYIAECKKTINQLKDQSQAIKREMDNMRDKCQLDLDKIENHFKDVIHKKGRQLKEDYVSYSTESFRLNKEISKLVRDKMQIEMDTMQAMSKVIRLEKQLQGVDMGLECDNEELLQTQLRGTFQNARQITH